MVRKLSQKEAEAKISKNGLQLISPYINRRTKVTVKCYCGQVFRTNELINTDTQHIELTVKDWN